MHLQTILSRQNHLKGSKTRCRHLMANSCNHHLPIALSITDAVKACSKLKKSRKQMCKRETRQTRQCFKHSQQRILSLTKNETLSCHWESQLCLEMQLELCMLCRGRWPMPATQVSSCQEMTVTLANESTLSKTRTRDKVFLTCAPLSTSHLTAVTTWAWKKTLKLRTWNQSWRQQNTKGSSLHH